MSFLKRLFGGGSVKPDAPSVAAEQEHNGFTIRATPYREAGQFQVCGVIEKADEAGNVRSHRFVRADRFPDEQVAADMALIKGRQIVDFEGERIFEQKV